MHLLAPNEDGRTSDGESSDVGGRRLVFGLADGFPLGRQNFADG